MILILAEKPSVARDLAKVVGASSARRGYFEGKTHIVTWAIGHLVTLPEPHQINPKWKTWSFTALPMLPERWPLMASPRTLDQFEIVKKLLNECESVVCATDAGREGELIFRYIYELAECQKPVKRLWISSLTKQAIEAGLSKLKPSAEFDKLADAARARSRADWLVGMNLSRAYALKSQEQLFVGRVQTPTLAMIVERDLKIRNFITEEYETLEVQFKVPLGDYRSTYLGKKDELKKPFISQKEKRFALRSPEALEILRRVRESRSEILLNEAKKNVTPPPLLYDLTDLQRNANQTYAFSANRTLELAQSLYEKHKLISYPRTGSQHLSMSVAQTLPEIVLAIRGPYDEIIDTFTGTTPLSSRFVDDTQVTDHHAIIPTGKRGPHKGLSADEQKIYDLICRRVLMAWQPDYVTEVTNLLTVCEQINIFKSTGTAIAHLGWKKLVVSTRERGAQVLLPSGLTLGLEVAFLSGATKAKKTEPPPHLNDATLLTLMETAGKNIDDVELARAMKDSGLGTPATRANIIETLLARNYIERKAKMIIATEMGFRLIEMVHPSVKSPELTGRWEKKLSEIQSGKETLSKFIEELEKEISERILEIKGQTFSLPKIAGQDPVAALAAPLHVKERTAPENLSKLLKDRFDFANFRQSQEHVCRAVVEGKNVLLVMPTGAGKSLCYQLPSIARGGTCLVISPLIALIEDQVAKLSSLGFKAERIHSGRSREDSRNICRMYQQNELDFLFISPERLGVPGFVEFLSRITLSLIAVDEAHCISQWGHDFRPDYRLLGERIREFGSIPIIAMTATATPIVQDDICKQLNLTSESRFIEGFRRSNISIQVNEVSIGERESAIFKILKPKDRIPAIVYAPTRKKTDELKSALSEKFRTGSYHAGMTPEARSRIQSEFISGKLDVIVATVAFGMGIDKANVRTVIHASLPGSVEAYYQEIGRAGRDGKPSDAYLLYSYSDQKTHEFFLDMNYPDESFLLKIYNLLAEQAVDKDYVRSQLRSMDQDIFERALEQLWVHRGVLMDPDEHMRRGATSWITTYREQLKQKQMQLEQILAFANGGTLKRCRMTSLVTHFGERTETETRCEICDICNPESRSEVVDKRTLGLKEKTAVETIFKTLLVEKNVAMGKLFEKVASAVPSLNRQIFEKIIAELERLTQVSLVEESFEKGGETIRYRRATRHPRAQFQNFDYELVQISGNEGKKKKSRLKKTARPKTKIRKAKKPIVPLSAAARPDFERIRAWRLDQARRLGIPAFRILSDRVLQSICKYRPSNKSELTEISGVTRKAVDQYGDAIIALLR